MPSAVDDRLLVADALEDGVGAEAAGQLAHALDRLVAALADDVGRAELPRERDPVRVAAEEDDPLRAEPLRGDHAAEADGAVADDGGGLAGADPGARRAAWWPVAITSVSVSSDGISASSAADRQHDERAVRLRDAHRLALPAVDAVASRTGRRGGRSVCSPSRQKTQVPSEQRNGATTTSPGFTVRTSAPTASTTPMNSWPMRRPVSLVLHRRCRARGRCRRCGAGDADEGVGRLDEAGVGDVLDPDVAGAVHDGCAHVPPFRRLRREAWALLKHACAPSDRPC